MQMATQLTSLAVVGVLCRWIAPADFGEFTTAMLLVALPRMAASSGFGLATIQQADAPPAVRDRLFWWNLALSGAASAASVLLGWCGAWLADSPRLLPVTMTLAGTTVIAALGSQHLALLERGLQIRRSAVARWLAQTVAGVAAIGLAVVDGSWLALAAQQYVEWTMLAVLAWRGERWRPAWPWRSRLEDDAGGRAKWREALRFSGHATAANLVFFASQNADKLLLYCLLGSAVAGASVDSVNAGAAGDQGVITGIAAVGMYGVAYNFMMKPVLLVSAAVSSVMLPSLARVAGQPRLYQEQAARFYRLTASLLFPCGVGMVLTADEIMRVLAGSRWEGSGRLLTWLAPAVLAHGLYNITGSLLMACGRASWLARAACVLGLVQLQGYAAGYWLGGMVGGDAWGATQGVAASFSAVLLLVLFLPYQYLSMRETGVEFTNVFRGLFAPFRNAALMGVAVWFIRVQCQSWSGWGDLPALARLGVLSATGVAVYGMLARRELRDLLGRVA
jgi:PST family polysaccharide transporter